MVLSGKTGVLILAFVALTTGLLGCGQRETGVIGVVEPSSLTTEVAEYKSHRLFVATTRAKDDDPSVLFSGQRSENLNLARVTVTVPARHVAGQIETSKSWPPNPSDGFTIADPDVFGSDGDFARSLEAELNRRRPEDRTLMYFVHGYNTTLSEAILRMGQFIHDSGYKGVPVLFSWASGGDPLSYVYDLNSVLEARDDLLHAIYLSVPTNARALDVVSHSMGNLLVVEAMRQAKLEGRFNRTGRLRYVILASPDIDVDLFKRQLDVFPPSERRFYVLVSKDDRTLSFSRWLARGVPRVGSEDAEQLSKLGVTVFDLSEIEVDGSNHTKFANSPEIVRLIGNRLNADPPLPTSRIVGSLGRTLQGATIQIFGPR